MSLRIGSDTILKKADTLTSMSSFSSMYSRVPPLSSARRSRSLVFRSWPTPKTNRRQRPWLALLTFAWIFAGSRSLMVGSPSVMKTIMYGRSPFSFGPASMAARSASLMFVPPAASTRCTMSLAASMFSRSAGTSESRNGRVCVANAMTLKRSFSRRLDRQNNMARFACAILSPAMLPEVSKTKHTSFGLTRAASRLSGGAMRAMKYPSSPAGR